MGIVYFIIRYALCVYNAKQLTNVHMRTFATKNFYVYVYRACYVKHFQIPLAVQRDVIAIVISAEFELNPKIYIKVARYLLQTHTTIQLNVINVKDGLTEYRDTNIADNCLFKYFCSFFKIHVRTGHLVIFYTYSESFKILPT